MHISSYVHVHIYVYIKDYYNIVNFLQNCLKDKFLQTLKFW